MQRLFVLSTLAASLALASQAPAQRSATPGPAGNEQAASERLYTAEGIISGVGSDEVELRTDEGTLDFELDDSVRIYREGRRVPRQAIQSGDRARATYQESQDGVLDDEVLVRLDLEPGTAE